MPDGSLAAGKRRQRRRHIPIRSLVQLHGRSAAGPARLRGGRRPCLRTVDGEAGDRHASALELFFDLVFVVAVGELAGSLEHDPTATGLLHYLFLFVPVWWAWVGFTFYADRFDNDDLAYRLVMIAAMVAVIWLAVSLPDVFTSEAGSAWFVASYVVVRLLLVGLYLRVHHYLPAARPLTGRYLVGFLSGLAVWSASLALPPPARYGAWALGMVIELLPPLVSGRAIAAIPFHVSHIPERFGLFTLIVLGETITMDAIAIAPKDLDLHDALVATMGFLIATALWWLYFDCVDASPLRRWAVTGQAYVYGHLVVFAAITATGVGVILVTGEHATAGAGRVAITGGTGAFMVMIGVIHGLNTGPRGDVKAWTRLALGAACLLLGALGDPLPLPVLLAVVLVGLSVQAGYEVRLLALAEARDRPA